MTRYPGKRIRVQAWEQVLDQLREQVDNQVWVQVLDQVRIPAWERVRNQLRRG